MSQLPRSLAAWGSPAFAETLRTEVEALPPAELPLHRLANTGHALDAKVSVALLGSRETKDAIAVRLGCFFEEIVPGCSCGFEAEPQAAYGELQLRIDRATAQAEWEPVAGDAP